MNQKHKPVPLFCLSVTCVTLQTFFLHASSLVLFVWLRGTRRVGLCCRSSLPTPGSHSTCMWVRVGVDVHEAHPTHAGVGRIKTINRLGC